MPSKDKMDPHLIPFFDIIKKNIVIIILKGSIYYNLRKKNDKGIEIKEILFVRINISL